VNMKLLLVAGLLFGKVFAGSCNHEIYIDSEKYVDGFDFSALPDDQSGSFSLFKGDTQFNATYYAEDGSSYKDWQFMKLCAGSYVLKTIDGITSYVAELDQGYGVTVTNTDSNEYNFTITEGVYTGLPIPDDYCGYSLEVDYSSCNDISASITVTKDSDGSTVFSTDNWYGYTDRDVCSGTYKATIDGNGKDVMGSVWGYNYPSDNGWDVTFEYFISGDSPVSICFSVPYSKDTVSICGGNATVYDSDVDYCASSGSDSGSTGSTGDSGSTGASEPPKSGTSKGSHLKGGSNSGSSSGSTSGSTGAAGGSTSGSTADAGSTTNGSLAHQISLFSIAALAVIFLS